MRILAAILIVSSISFFTLPNNLSAEPPEYQTLRDGDGADRWLAKQLARADDFEKDGRYAEAEEIRDFAEAEYNHRKGLVKIFEEESK